MLRGLALQERAAASSLQYWPRSGLGISVPAAGIAGLGTMRNDTEDSAIEVDPVDAVGSPAPVRSAGDTPHAPTTIATAPTAATNRPI